MTPVREALEKERADLIAANEAATAWGAAVGARCERIREIERELRSGKIDAGCVAAPGEPCAPQPAAGWDEATGYAERLAVTLWGKHFKNDAPQWKPLSGDLIGLLTQIDNMTSALRREASAPAEGVRDHILTYIKTGEKDQLESISGEGGFRLPDDWFGSVAIAPTGAQELYAMPAATKSFLDDPTVDLKQWLIEEVSANWSVQKKPGFGRIGPVTILRDPYSAKPYVLFYVTARALPDALDK